jgi:hypothetical protein
MFHYKLHAEDGSELGEAAYADWVNPGDEILTLEAGRPKRLRVLDFMEVLEEESPYDGMLRVEAT